MNDLHQFVAKWRASQQKESAASQEHFIDLCRVLGEATPNEADPTGDFYAFEKGAPVTGVGGGFADAWYQGHFGWEYKGKAKDLNAAYRQLLGYHESLGQPPLLVVCDLHRFEVHTKWANKESWIYSFTLDDLLTQDPISVRTAAGNKPENAHKLTALQVLKALWEDPSRLEPEKTTDDITKEAAKAFEAIANRLRTWTTAHHKQRLYDDMRIARFITRVVFCMFASDVGLLPRGAFSEVVKQHQHQDVTFRAALAELFRKMSSGGLFGPVSIPHFNGGLFVDDDVPEHITTEDIKALADLDAKNWTDVEPAIFGTLFERVLDHTRQRAKLGAHYTSRDDIERIVEPVLMAPLRRDWEETLQQTVDALDTARLHGATEPTLRDKVRAAVDAFLGRLAAVTVLDPACGSGNFLYVALALLKGLEKEALAFASLHGAHGIAPRVHPRQLFGIEMNPYAHELASIVIWIGYIQWKHKNGFPLVDEDPILQRLDQVELKDAILARDDAGLLCEPEWPAATVIVGNPPFLGGKRLRTELGDDYVDNLFTLYNNRVRREADLCCYWFERARRMIESGSTRRAGLLATQAIRGGANRETLQRIKATGDIFFAESDRPWVLEGAAVRVSMVGFDDGTEVRRFLDGREVEGVNADLSHRTDLTTARRLKENLGICFQGPVKVGKFEIEPTVARGMLNSPNPHGKPSRDVVRPWVNGEDLTDRPRGLWIIDFGSLALDDAAKYEAPFEHVKTHVKPQRDKNRDRQRRERWWQLGRSGTDLRRATEQIDRIVCTPRVAKFRLFKWAPATTLPDSRVFAFARDDDYFFGILHSRIHEVWSLAKKSVHGDGLDGGRPVYNNTTCFETFPFPRPTDDQRDAIAAAARELDTLREGWLNPPEDSLSPSDLKKRTLTNLYNAPPTWLQNAHRKLNEAVFAAYGWDPKLPDAEILARLLALNLDREPA